jgi:nucleoside-diphosphate-sugar epimerase
VKILVTGSRGWCGLGMIPVLLEYGHEVVGLDVAPLPEGYRASPNHCELQGDIQDIGCLVSAMEGCQAVIHAVVAHFSNQTPYQVPGLPGKTLINDNFLSYRVDVTGTFNIFEVARQSGIRQVVVLSSSAVIFDHITSWEDKVVHVYHVDAHSPPRYHSFYGFVKHMQEQIGLHYAQNDGMSVTILRPWWVVDGPTYRTKLGHPLAEDIHPLTPTGMLCRTDLGEICHLALQHPDIQYDIFYPVAGPWVERFFDVEHLKQVLGWIPRFTFAELPIRYLDYIK